MSYVEKIISDIIHATSEIISAPCNMLKNVLVRSRKTNNRFALFRQEWIFEIIIKMYGFAS